MSFKDDIEENFKVGLLDLLILKMLDNDKMYGYQIRQKIFEESNGKIDIKEGSLYGPFYRLEKKGMIVSQKELVGKKRFRMYYNITELGKEFLEVGTNVFDEIYDGAIKILGDRHEQK